MECDVVVGVAHDVVAGVEGPAGVAVAEDWAGWVCPDFPVCVFEEVVELVVVVFGVLVGVDGLVGGVVCGGVGGHLVAKIFLMAISAGW